MRFALIAVAVIAVAATSGGIAYAAGFGRDDDKPLTGTTLQKATDAALQHTHGGTVVETEHGDDGAAYSVEVRVPAGAVVEINLDEDFNVIGEESDDDANEQGDDDD